MPEPTIIKQCRKVNVNFPNTQGSGRRLVKICVTKQNGSEIITAHFVDTGVNPTITPNLLELDVIRM